MSWIQQRRAAPWWTMAIAATWMPVASAFGATDGSGLEEIVVTAQKRAQNPQDVGIALSVVSASDLAATGASTAGDVAKSVPAVVLTQPNGPSSFSLSIRGVTQNDFADHQESPASIYIDDVYVSQMAGLAFSLFDVDRVEVLRGPQGTLFGRNATGGLAHYVTQRPTDDTGGYVAASFGQRNLLRVEGALNGALASGIDGRFSFQSNQYDPLVRNVSGGAPNSEDGNDRAARGQLLFKNVGGGELLLNARAARQDVHAGAWEQYPILPGANGYDTLAGPNDDPYGTGPGRNASGLPASGPFVTHDNQAGYARISTNGYTAKFTDHVGDTTFTAIGDHSALKKDYQEDSDASPYTLFQFFNGSNVSQDSLELRLDGDDKQIHWTTGLYGLHINGHYYEGWQGPAFFGAEEYNVDGIPAYGVPGNPNAIIATNPNSSYAQYTGAAGPWPYTVQPATPPPAFAEGGALTDPNGYLPATAAPYQLVTKSYAAFGQVEYRLSPLVGVTAGARLTRDEKDFNYSWHPYLYSPQSLTGATVTLTRPSSAVLGDLAASRRDTLWAGKLQLDLHVAQDTLVYLSYNRGVKGGGYTAPLFPATIADVSALSFKPEELTSYELGFKGEFLAHTLRVNGAAYYYNYHDYQALIYTVSLNQLIVNANARHKGAELQVEWAPDSHWQFDLGAAWVDAIVRNVPGLCCTSSGQAVYGDYVPPNAPKITANALARYTWPVGAGAHVSLQVDGQYLSKFFFNIGDAPAVQQDAFALFNARVNYTPAGERAQFGLSVDNLADKHYSTMGFDNLGINGLAQRYPGLPRWVKVHASYKF